MSYFEEEDQAKGKTSILDHEWVALLLGAFVFFLLIGIPLLNVMGVTL